MCCSLDSTGNWASELFSWFYRQLSQWTVLLILQATESVNCSLDSTGNWANVLFSTGKSQRTVLFDYTGNWASELFSWFYRQLSHYSVLLILQATEPVSCFLNSDSGNWASELFSWFYRQLVASELFLLILQATEPANCSLDSTGNWASEQLFS